MPSPTRPTHPEIEVMRDAMHRACILVAVATRALDRIDAVRAVGYLPGELERDLLECAEAGLRLALAAREAGFQWQSVWTLHAQDAHARASSGAGNPPPSPARPTDRRVVLPPGARLTPDVDGQRPSRNA